MWQQFKEMYRSSRLLPGMTGEILDLLDLEKLDGIVIEALGAGNLPSYC